MISVQNLSVQFGGEPLFDHISFIINEKDRIGLVGRNGAGKSTLLRIIDNRHQPDEGNVVIPERCTIGYLEQEMVLKSDRTVYGEAKSAFREVESLLEKIEKTEQELKERTDFDSREYQKIMKRHHDAYERFQLIGGHSVEADIEKTLIGLGFRTSDFTRPLSEFSSGWQMRVELAKILLLRPSLVMLDEPTNHLDIESIQWLEEYLINYPGAVIIVSHDRAFLDNVTKRTIEITFGKVYDYRTNYSDYTQLREERMESQLAAFNNQQRQVRQIERFVERFRYKNTKSKQVQSRIKMLEKLDEVEIDLVDESSIHFTFPPAPHAGKIIVEASGLAKSYPGTDVFSGLNFHVINSERIAFVGRNGEGKTTLSKILAGVTDFEGNLKFGQHVIKGYYAQDQSDSLDPNKTVFKTIDDIAVGDIRPKIRTILGSFLFSGDDTEKKVKVLSGGERSRLSLAKLLLTPSNLLILDETTNHLDMRSKDILKNALLQFTGTLIIVSHDRDFLQGLTNRVFEFRDQTIKEYIGDIYDFLEQRKLRNLQQLEKKERNLNREQQNEPASGSKMSWEKRKLEEKEERKLKTRISRCESDIESLEKKIREREEMLGNPEKFSEQVGDEDLYKEYESLKTSLQQEMDLWTRLHEELDAKPRDGSSR
ncbi:MAG: ABC-F family ATP-binding cassette domain-containing protein [Bacteroidales bacterium]|nr:ABC-F family ATP-binding cassette domain-containing protein [Bacteroidales bacterium]